MMFTDIFLASNTVGLEGESHGIIDSSPNARLSVEKLSPGSGHGISRIIYSNERTPTLCSSGATRLINELDGVEFILLEFCCNARKPRESAAVAWIEAIASW